MFAEERKRERKECGCVGRRLGNTIRLGRMQVFNKGARYGITKAIKRGIQSTNMDG